MNKIGFIISFFLVLFCHSNGNANDLPTNKQIIDSIFDAFLSRIAIQLKEKKITEIRVANIGEFSYFQNKLINELVKNNIRIDDNSLVTIKLNIEDFQIQYIESNDELTRIIDINATLHFLEKNGEIKLLDKLNTSYKDQLSVEDVSAVENSLFPFTQGNKPKPKKSLFEEIIEPVIIVSTAIITVVLFFSVRTK